MIRSMTGFGSASGSADGVAFDVEIRSVNNRGFKGTIRLPDMWGAAEADIDSRLRDRLVRGSVTLSVRMRLSSDQAGHTVNTVVLERYLKQLEGLDIQANPTLRIDLVGLMQLPGVCTPPAMDDIAAQTLPALMGLVDEAIEGVIQMRQQEGQKLADDLLARCDELEAAMLDVAEHAPDVVKDYRDRLVVRIGELLEGVRITSDDEAIAREVAFFADRCDIAEELQRLTTHIEQFRTDVRADDAAGRKLDFIAQEMLREANTIGSKANDVSIAGQVVTMKAAIDRIKEQVQNAE
jgi:uncharacterized protein (TIGR00255 family)